MRENNNIRYMNVKKITNNYNYNNIVKKYFQIKKKKKDLIIHIFFDQSFFFYNQKCILSK